MQPFVNFENKAVKLLKTSNKATLDETYAQNYTLTINRLLKMSAGEFVHSYVNNLPTPGVTNLFETDSCILCTDSCEGLPVWYIHFWNKNLLNLPSIMLSINIEDSHQWEDTKPVSAIVKTSPRATHVVCAGDLVLAGTMLVILTYTHQISTSLRSIQTLITTSPNLQLQEISSYTVNSKANSPTNSFRLKQMPRKRHPVTRTGG